MKSSACVFIIYIAVSSTSSSLLSWPTPMFCSSNVSGALMKADIWARSEETPDPAVAAGEAGDAGDVAAGVGEVVGRTAPALVAPSVAAGEAGDAGDVAGVVGAVVGRTASAFVARSTSAALIASNLSRRREA